MLQDDYQYAEMSQELRECVRRKELTMNSEIQIMRDDKAKIAGNHPIIEWYYDQRGMSELASGILDDIEDAAGTLNITSSTVDGLSQDIIDVIQYVEDMPYLEKTTVSQVIWEMEKTLRS